MKHLTSLLLSLWCTPATSTLYVTWYAPFLSGGGYSSEAISYATFLVEHYKDNKFGIVQFGEQFDGDFYEGLPTDISTKLQHAFQIGSAQRNANVNTVAICHSTPDIWVPSAFPGWDESAPCPPPQALYNIGRTMYETDRVPQGWIDRCNRMDEIWVPSVFHVDTFVKSGVERSKLVVVPEAVDVDYFNPALYRPETLPLAADGHFKFLSVFKWERRKGWDVLLSAYFSEFTADDPVVLYIKTTPFYSDTSPQEQIEHYANETLGIQPDKLPRFFVIDHEIPLSDFPILYASADAFVLPHRGEGWGRPHAEAMSMALPVLATNWSGNTAFMNEKNSYPIDIEGTVLVNPDAPKTVPDADGNPVENLDAHMRWANPSIRDLRAKMRHVVNNQDEAIRIGYQARKDMVNMYSPKVVGKLVADELLRIERALSVKEDL